MMEREKIKQMLYSSDEELQNLAISIFYQSNKDFVCFSPSYQGILGHRTRVEITKNHFRIYENRWRGFTRRKNLAAIKKQRL